MHPCPHCGGRRKLLAFLTGPGFIEKLVRQSDADDATIRGEVLSGTPVDFSHGDVDESAFGPTLGSLDEFVAGMRRGGSQFTGAPIDPASELIITPGTQGALFLAIGATVAAGDRVAIVRAA